MNKSWSSDKNIWFMLYEYNKLYITCISSHLNPIITIKAASWHHFKDNMAIRSTDINSLLSRRQQVPTFHYRTAVTTAHPITCKRHAISMERARWREIINAPRKTNNFNDLPFKPAKLENKLGFFQTTNNGSFKIFLTQQLKQSLGFKNFRKDL